MDLIRSIEEYAPFNAQEIADKALILAALAAQPGVFSRENLHVHMTASAWIVNRRRDRALMAYHNIYRSWSWLGGHADGERDLLQVALREARALAEAGYYPRLSPRGIKVAGRTGIANCEMMLANMREGGMISSHDYMVAKAAATALCGGDIETGSLVDEQWLLGVERKLFVKLLKNPKTQQRIQHMLDTGKPLRN